MKNFKVKIGIIAPIIVSAYAIYSLWQLDNYETAMLRMEFSEEIVQLSKYMAQERGFTYVYAHMGKEDQDFVDIISEAGQNFDRHLASALGYAEQLDMNDYNKLIGLQSKLKDFRRIFKIIGSSARIQLLGKSSIPAVEWFDDMSGLISSLEEIYVVNLERINEDRKWLNLPVTIASSNARKAIWSLFELAGQERALVGAAIARQEEIPEEKTTASWLRIRKAWLELRDSMQGRLNNIELASVINAIENSFFGEYDRIRQQVMSASLMDAKYPIDAKAWLTQSTKAIDPLIAMSELLSKNDINAIAELEREFREEERRFSIFAFAFIALLIFMSMYYIYTLYIYNQNIKKLKILHKITGKLLKTTSALALERGVSRTAIASKTDVGDKLRARVTRKREATDELLLPALEDLQALQIEKHNYLIEGVRTAYERVAELRVVVDKYLEVADLEPPPHLASQVFDDFTRLIESTEELQLSAAHAFALGGQKTGFWSSNPLWYQNLAETAALRHFIWLMSEHAGRLRALVGSAISSRSGIPADDVRNQVNKVYSSWEIVKLEVLRGEDNTLVREAVEGVRDNFFNGDYPSILKTVISCSEKNREQPCYDLEADRWFDISSNAIEKIIELSNAVGRNSEERMSGMILAETVWSASVVVFSVLSIVLMVFAI